MKYYVESGNLKSIIDCDGPLNACVKAILKKINNSEDDFIAIEFEDTFFVSEKGFLSEREPFSVEIPMEKIYDTEEVISYLEGMPP